MEEYLDWESRTIRFTRERREHIRSTHPEMKNQTEKIRQTLQEPETVVKSRADSEIELVYRNYEKTPVTEKYLCVVVKTGTGDEFIVTAYFTDSIKEGEVVWKK